MLAYAVYRHSVLQSVNGDQERAADVLLGMSDPSYNSQQYGTGGQREQLVSLSALVCMLVAVSHYPSHLICGVCST